jgi:hypothetical protein
MTRAMAMLILMSFMGGSAGGPDDKADATLKLSQGHVAVGAGFIWGAATLSYHGRTYPVEVQGLSVFELGMSGAEAAGSVYNLSKLEEFSGNYTASGAGETVGGGTGLTAMKNEHGVVIEMRRMTQGASLKLAAEGVTLRATE